MAQRFAGSDAALPTEVWGFERGLQRACGIGLAAFVVQSVAVAVAGWELYPLWWFLGPGPMAIGAVGVAVVACLRGRSRTSSRLAAAGILAVACVLTALATVDTVTRTGTVVQPLVTGMVGLLGLMDRPIVSIPGVVVLVTAQILSMALTRPLDPAEVVLITFIQCSFPLAATVAGRLARRAAAAQDRAAAQLRRAILADRAAAASRSDRREQERELHDTVLSTLTALARGSLTDSPRLRHRCAADADYLRALRLRDAPDAPEVPDLADGLRGIATDLTGPGLLVTVEFEHADHPALPGPAVRAIVRAAREAVSNAARHSGADRVEIRLTPTAQGMCVEVVDCGRGVPAVDDRRGLGVRRSIIERMADVGGRGVVERVPGSGTRVVLTWPR